MTTKVVHASSLALADALHVMMMSGMWSTTCFQRCIKQFIIIGAYDSDGSRPSVSKCRRDIRKGDEYQM
jgi:hypothetical protein